MMHMYHPQTASLLLSWIQLSTVQLICSLDGATQTPAGLSQQQKEQQRYFGEFAVTCPSSIVAYLQRGCQANATKNRTSALSPKLLLWKLNKNWILFSQQRHHSSKYPAPLFPLQYTAYLSYKGKDCTLTNCQSHLIKSSTWDFSLAWGGNNLTCLSSNSTWNIQHHSTGALYGDAVIRVWV